MAATACGCAKVPPGSGWSASNCASEEPISAGDGAWALVEYASMPKFTKNWLKSILGDIGDVIDDVVPASLFGTVGENET